MADAVRALPASIATQINYVFADHLGTPRVITRNTDNQIIWRWDQADPFGLAPPNENPNALGAFKYNPRFPGQLFDAETGLYYNYHRDYNPGTGRYAQSDPIGLQGGINTYAYVNGNPVNFIDPTGEFGWQGAIIGGGMNAWFQFGGNYYVSGDFWQSVRCIELGDVAISSFLGLIGPGIIPGPGPGGLTPGQSWYIYWTRIFPAGFAFKRLSPRAGYGDDCECAGVSLGTAIGEILQIQ